MKEIHLVKNDDGSYALYYIDESNVSLIANNIPDVVVQSHLLQLIGTTKEKHVEGMQYAESA